MDHDPKTCRICLRNDRLKFDAKSGSHFVPHDSAAAFPLFRLYPIVAEHQATPEVGTTTKRSHRPTNPGRGKAVPTALR
jgi:hypothetical protein